MKTKPLIPVAEITAAGGSADPAGLRLDFTDVNGRQGVLDLSPQALATIRAALKLMPGPDADTAVQTGVVEASTKAALDDGGYGLALRLAGRATPMLLQIPSAIVPGLILQLRELEAFATRGSSRKQ